MSDRLLQRLRDMGPEVLPLVETIERLTTALHAVDNQFVERMQPIAEREGNSEYVRQATRQHYEAREYTNRQLAAALRLAYDVLPIELPAGTIILHRPTSPRSGDR